MDCRTATPSPRSVHSPVSAPAPGGPTPTRRPARARRGNLAGQPQLGPGPRPGTSLTLPGSIRGRPGQVWCTRLGGLGSADQAAELGTKARAAVQSASSQAISQGSHGSVPDPGPGRLSISRASSGGGPPAGTRGIPGSADRGAEPGTKARTAVRLASSQARSVRTRGAAIRPRDSEQAAAGHTARKDSETGRRRAR